MLKQKRSVTPEKAVEILEKQGTNISLEDAKKILDFLYKLGKLTLEHMFNR